MSDHEHDGVCDRCPVHTIVDLRMGHLGEKMDDLRREVREWREETVKIQADHSARIRAIEIQQGRQKQAMAIIAAAASVLGAVAAKLIWG